MRRNRLAAVVSLTLSMAMASALPAAASQDRQTQESSEDQDRPEMPSGEAPSGDRPEMPSGEAPSGDRPEMPSGEAPSGDRPEMPSGEKPSGEAPGKPGDGNGMGSGGGSSANIEYTAATEFTEDTETDGESYDSEETDENAVLVQSGADIILNNSTITRNSSDSTGGDNASFYGVGAAALVTDGTLTISGSEITTDAKGAAGVFAYGDGTAYVLDTTIRTEQDTAGGIHAAGGGTLYAWDLDVETNGESSAAIRSDRGGGTMVVNGGTYTSNGTGSPAIYSTADIAVSNAALTANGSEAICIEGLNSIHLFDCDLTGNMSDNEQNDCTWNVILYQSMSGDSEVGNSTFEMNGGTLTAKNGGMFYTTNTESTITLQNVDITGADDAEFFLRCTGNNNARGWGQTGSNGADCLFTAIDQTMDGDVIWDSISQLDFYMTGESVLTGAVLQDGSYAGDGGDGWCNLTIGEDSTWIVTGDSTLTELSCAGNIVDEDGKSVTIQGTDGTVYQQGDSNLVITVDTYQDSAELSGASETTDWSDYETEKPQTEESESKVETETASAAE